MFNHSIISIRVNENSILLINGNSSNRYICDATKDYNKKKEAFRRRILDDIDIRKMKLDNI